MTYRPGFGPVSEAQALEVHCPKCKVKAGERCVYLRPKNVGPYTPVDPRWGMPTQKAHNERRYAHDIRRQRREREARLAAMDADRREFLLHYERHVAPAAAAIRAFDQEEHRQLVAWVRQHGAVLWSLPPAPMAPASCCLAAQQGLVGLDWRTSTEGDYAAVLHDHARQHGVALDEQGWYDGPHAFLPDPGLSGKPCCMWCGGHEDSCTGSRAAAAASSPLAAVRIGVSMPYDAVAGMLQWAHSLPLRGRRREGDSMEKNRSVGVTTQGLMVARQQASATSIPAWLIAAEAERAAANYLTGGYSPEQAKNVCPACFTVRAVGTGVCAC